MFDDDKDNYFLGVIMAQHSLKAGLKRFGVKGSKAITNDISQLHDMKTFFPMDTKIIIKEE